MLLVKRSVHAKFKERACSGNRFLNRRRISGREGAYCPWFLSVRMSFKSKQRAKHSHLFGEGMFYKARCSQKSVH